MSGLPAISSPSGSEDLRTLLEVDRALGGAGDLRARITSALHLLVPRLAGACSAIRGTDHWDVPASSDAPVSFEVAEGATRLLLRGDRAPGERDELLVHLVAARLEAACLQDDAERARSAAEEERRKLHELLVQVPVPILVNRGPELVYEFCNDAALAEAGGRSVVGLPLRQVLPDLEADMWAVLERVLSGETVITPERPTRIDRRWDGQVEEIWQHLVQHPLRDVHGTIDGVVTMSIDVTEKVRARRSLEVLLRITGALSSAASPEDVAGALVDALRTELEAAECALALLDEGTGTLRVLAGRGLPPELSGKLGTFSVDDELPLAHVARTGEPFFGGAAAVRARFPALPEGFVTVGAAVLPITHGPVRAAMGIGWRAPHRFEPAERSLLLAIAAQVGAALDRARLYREAQEAIRARDMFLSVAAHELNTPITTLLLQARMLEAGAAGAARGRVLRSALRLRQLVRELLDVSAAGEGRLALRRTETDLCALVREVAEDHRAELTRLGSQLELRLPEERVPLLVDPGRVEQVLVNLLQNAGRYGAGRPVEVALDGTAGGVCISVRDQGIGIAPGDQVRIFERFERAAGAPYAAGLGLGLWISRQHAMAHGGSLEVESEPGRGATFRLRLPA